MNETDKRCCADWAPGIEAINGPIILQTHRSGGAYQYSGKAFRYCPWCGTDRLRLFVDAFNNFDPAKLSTRNPAPGASPPSTDASTVTLTVGYDGKIKSKE